MSTHDMDGYTSMDSYERYSRHLNRKVILSEKRNRSTDVLPAISGDASAAKLSARQVSQLREENRRLRQEVEELQRHIAHSREAEVQFEQEAETIRNAHQLEIEQYQNHMREMMDELNQKQTALQDMEHRYQELYHSFQDAVEEEAGKLVTVASQTLVLSPEHTPPILHDVMKTLEFQVKQTEDQHVAELMALMRQAQRKNELLENELAQEHQKLIDERQRVFSEQNRIREQAVLRYKMIDTHLRTRFASQLALLTTFVIIVYGVLELAAHSALKLPFNQSIFLPILVCAVLAFLVVRFASNAHYHRPPKKQERK